jgi:hypothetical protein
VLQLHRCVPVDHAVEWKQVAVSSTTKHFEEATLLAGVDYLLDANLSFNYFQVEFTLNPVLHIEDGLPRDSVHDAGVIGWGDQLSPSEARLLEDKHI